MRMMLENRHVLGLIVVSVLSVVFLLAGFEIGDYILTRRGQVTVGVPPSVATAEQPAPQSANKPSQAGSAVAGAPSAKRPSATASIRAEPPASSGRKASAAPLRLESRAARRGTIFLQLAALSNRRDAYAMAAAAHQKGFPAFVLAPTTDKLYRVQVGPYTGENAAHAAMRGLERAGFEVFLKR